MSDTLLVWLQRDRHQLLETLSGGLSGLVISPDEAGRS